MIVEFDKEYKDLVCEDVPMGDVRDDNPDPWEALSLEPDERKRLYSRAIKDRECLPIKGKRADGSNKPVDLEATVILKRYLRKKPSTYIKLDDGNAIEAEIIKERKHKLLSMMRALG